MYITHTEKINETVLKKQSLFFCKDSNPNEI